MRLLGRRNRNRPVATASALVAAASLAACGASSGIVPIAPDTYTLSEMRSQAVGGGPAAQGAVLAEAAGFCRQQGRSVRMLDLQPGGDPRGYYWPTAFSATFQCVVPNIGGPRVD